MKKSLMGMFALLLSTSLVWADVLPEYNANKEKLIRIEGVINAADFPDWVFFQRISNEYDDITFFDVVNEEGVLGCDRTNYIQELWAVKTNTPEEKQQLIEEGKVYSTQVKGLSQQARELWNQYSNTAQRDGQTPVVYDERLKPQITNVENQMKENAKASFLFLQEKETVHLFSGVLFWEIGCREHEVVKKKLTPDKVITTERGETREIKINHLTITPKMLTAEPTPLILDEKTAQLLSPIIPEEVVSEEVAIEAEVPSIERNWRESLRCRIKSLFNTTCS